MTLEKCIKINDSLSNTMTKPDCSQTDHPIKVAEVDAPPKHLPSSTNDADPDFICPVCSSPSISSCRNCKKISYCGKAHQRLHWRVHRAECFPLIHQYDPHILGSRLIATRNIKPGEIIWTEKALLSGPALPTAIGRSSTYRRGEGEEEKAECSTNPTAVEELVCLGCFQVINTDYRCPCCSLPMCGPNCVGDHVELECKIFTSLRHEQQLVDGSSHLAEGQTKRPQWDGKCYHGVITIIRGVLLKEVDPPRWKKLLELDEMWNGKECDNSKKISSSTNFGQFCHEFIMSLGLLNVTNEDVALVLRVISYRRCEVYDPPSPDLWERHCWTSKPHAFHLFYTACQATPSCVPNSSWIIQRDSTATTSTTQIHLRALLPIQFGRTVTLSYANAEKGIKDRQTLLPRHGESTVSCECERCKDPEELATFFSAIKCPGDHHENSSKSLTAVPSSTDATGTDMPYVSPTTLTTNWLLPTTVQVQLKQGENNTSRFNKELMWQCHDCGLTKDFNYYNQVVSHVEKEFCDICFVSQTKEEKVGRAWRTSLIENLESLSQKYSNCFSVHPNHCAIYEVEMVTLELMSSQLSDLKGALTDVKWTLLVERFTSLCRKWLEVADVLWPGLSRQRGQLLYYYQQALVIQLILSISRRMRGGGEDDDETVGEQELSSSELQDFSKIQQSLLEKEFLKILNIRKVVVNIFCYDDNATIGRQYANSLVLKCPEIEILKHYVFQTNKA